MICDAIKIVTTILKNSKSNHAFHELVREMGDDGRFVCHSEVRWLSRERDMEEVGKLREELVLRFNGREDHRAHLSQNLFWLARPADFGMCDYSYPSHTAWGKILAHSANSITVSKGTLDDGIKFNSETKNSIDCV